MYGTDPTCVFLVFCNPGAGGDEALDHWYMKIHGPDALENGSFQALHRYQAIDDTYPARFLAVWEGSFTTMADARAYIAPRADGLRKQGRVTEDMTVTWALMAFRNTVPTTEPTPDPIETVTLVEGGISLRVIPRGRPYIYGGIVLHESGESLEKTQRLWDGVGKPGPAPRGTYTSIFNDDAPPPTPVDGIWVSHWRPIGSLEV